MPRNDSPDPWAWKKALVADLGRVAVRDRWGSALMAIGWVHLLSFLLSHYFHTHGYRHTHPFLELWLLEFFAVVLLFRTIAGPDWYRATPLGAILVRVWATFLLLSFNVTSMNTLAGLDHVWFKPVLTTLATFGFATTAYLVDLRFFIPAVQMYFTGLLMLRFPQFDYVIHGVSWCAALQVIGFTIERRRMPAPASIPQGSARQARRNEMVADPSI